MRFRLRLLGLLAALSTLFTTFVVIDAPPAQAQGSFDQELIRLANNHRASLGIAPLVSSSSISAGALSWSQTMLRTGNFQHASRSELGNLAENIAFSHGPVGQPFGVTWNTGAGALPSYCTSRMDYTSAEFIMCSWLSSSGHRRAIENPNYRQIGSGTATGSGEFGRKTYSTHRFSAAAPTSTSPTPTPAPAPPVNSRSIEPGHSVDSNERGHVATASLRTNGELLVRRDTGNGWSAWQQLGNAGWVSADLSIDPNGTVHIAAVKVDGQLYTQRWNSNGGFAGWIDHGFGWDTTTTPSISTNGTQVILGAITNGGQLKTKTFGSSWSGATTHGLAGWGHVDVDIARDGDIWFVGVKDDGRLYVRKRISGRWSGFARMGANTWSADTPPAIAAHSNGVVFGAVKRDGRLYTRRQTNGTWSSWSRQGLTSWASIDVAVNESGVAWIAAHTSWGRLYTRSQSASGSWSGWTQQGRDTWSAAADASIAVGPNSQPVVLAVKEFSVLYIRSRTGSGWSGWARVGDAVWATGR